MQVGRLLWDVKVSEMRIIAPAAAELDIVRPITYLHMHGQGAEEGASLGTDECTLSTHAQGQGPGGGVGVGGGLVCLMCVCVGV